jgi:hypothetical protein
VRISPPFMKVKVSPVGAAQIILASGSGRPIVHAPIHVIIRNRHLLEIEERESARELVAADAAEIYDTLDRPRIDEHGPVFPEARADVALSANTSARARRPRPERPRRDVVAEFDSPGVTSTDGVIAVRLPELRPGRYFVEAVYRGDEVNPRTIGGDAYDVRR